MTVPVQDAFDRLLKSYGPQRWWPGEGPFEILVGTVLVQNTNWRNVEKAIDNLREAGVMTPEKLFALDPEELSELIRPAGYYQVKTKRLRNLLRLIVDRYDGSLETMFAGDMHALREELLDVNGVGPETADCILLYVGNFPKFIADGYAKMANGILPVLYTVLPIERFTDGLDRLESRRVFGKIVVTL